MTRRPRTALLLALAGGFVLLGWTPSGRTGQPQQPDPAQGPPSSPPPHTLDRAGSVIEIARDLARVRVRCDTLSRQFDAARRAFGRANYQRTVERVEQLLRTYNGPSCPDNEPDDSHATDGGSSPARSLRSPTAFASPEATVDHTSDSSTSVADRARLLAARALLKRDDGERALAFAERVEPTSTPAPWSVQWLRARALQTSDRPDRAAKAYRAVVRSGPPAPTHRARARRAHSLLDAGRWRSAVRAIDSLLSRFPQYPRRFELMFGRGRALEAMGDFRRAARAYQRTWLRFPHKPEGDRALARLDTLRLQGVDVPEVEPAGRFEHYRRLRVHKHWDLAHELLTSLERDLDDAREPTELRHRIWMQLAMNAYVPKRDRKALEYFSKLQRAYRQGRRAGIDIDRVRRYRSKALARLGELDGARRALAARYEGYSEYYRDLQLAEFFRDHGEYERAFELLDPNFPEWRKRRWSYTWLLYKTGRHERALENFGRLARYRDGREEARAMYWRARTMGKSGRRDEAKTLYRKLVAEHPLSYYGIQARNRLLDMRRRASVGGLFASRTRSVLDSSRRVLAELDRAARDPQRTPARRMVAPRTRQKRPATQPGSNACDGIGERTRFCHLMSGRVPPGTRRLVSRILSPLRSPYGIAIGAVRGLAIPKGRQTPKESTTSATAGSGDGETDLDAPADAVDSRWRTDARIHWPPDRDPNGGV
ncbi:MAG: tetratricopeptide repeat protein, partial [Bradymonadaceae bacterium]